MIRMIAAIDRERGLAKQGFQPWFIPQDEQYFTQMTKQYGGEVLVGSTTYRTFKGPLAERRNYVLTRDKTPIEGVELVHDLEKFLRDYKGRNLWVVGGANVFAQVLTIGKVDELYITHIEANFGCNQFFPDYSKTHSLISQSELHEENGFIFRYAIHGRQLGA